MYLSESFNSLYLIYPYPIVFYHQKSLGLNSILTFILAFFHKAEN
ncbi:hypothetical protein RU93_GL002009 [Enterococcus aquimarinus]|uniref:Uncharacterized protein n=1 Tax=Enterococcus aquimarinus TaxID=328396 RepID=A0A1L8QTK8_9ENTE|nr:hypothetical protein RU93_GL002009 [Enterococcus aquimarinus]